MYADGDDVVALNQQVSGNSDFYRDVIGVHWFTLWVGGDRGGVVVHLSLGDIETTNFFSIKVGDKTVVDRAGQDECFNRRELELNDLPGVDRDVAVTHVFNHSGIVTISVADSCRSDLPFEIIEVLFEPFGVRTSRGPGEKAPLIAGRYQDVSLIEDDHRTFNGLTFRAGRRGIDGHDRVGDLTAEWAVIYIELLVATNVLLDHFAVTPHLDRLVAAILVGPVEHDLTGDPVLGTGHSTGTFQSVVGVGDHLDSEVEVAAAPGGVVYLDRQDIFTFFERVDVEQRDGFEGACRFVVGPGQFIEGGRGAFKVAAGDLDSIDVGDEGIIVVHVEGHGVDSRKIFDLKSVSQVDAYVGFFHVVEDRSDDVEAIAIAETGGGHLPVAGIKVLEGPPESRSSVFVRRRFVGTVGDAVSVFIQVQGFKVRTNSAAFEHREIDPIRDEYSRAILLGKRSPCGKKNEENSNTVQNSHGVPPGMNII